VILDGHRRFAKAEGFDDYRKSYMAGMQKLEELLSWAYQTKIPAVTVWVLSTDNLNRPASELNPYFEVLEEFFSTLPELGRSLDFSLDVTGSMDMLPDGLRASAKTAMAALANVDSAKWHVNIALCYGGRQEILDACKSLVEDLALSGVPAEEISGHIDEESFREHLYSSSLPDLDLVIRTSGEARLSGFLLWQSVYAECVFVDPYWPAFRRVDFLRALRDFAKRERRFGR
jgi:short-chain Z-isoprenyl diphosphate synthase